MSFKWATEWTRSDAIAGLALVLAAAAAGIAYQAESRAEKAERREAEAVAIAIGGKVRLIANSAELSAQFMQGFLDHRTANPKDHAQMDNYIIEFAVNLKLPELVLSPEQITALAHTDSNVAGLLTACSDRGMGIQADTKKFIDARPSQLTDTQLSIAQIMPYRLREMGKACKASLDALVVLVSDLPKILGPIPGTVGEIMEAETAALRTREHGFYVKFHNSEAKSSSQN